MVLQRIDWPAIGAYVIAVASLLRPRKPKSSEDYFLAGRSLLRPWLHAARLAFAVSMVALVSVSVATPRTSDTKLCHTSVSDWCALVRPGGGSGALDYRLWLTALLLVMDGLWWSMR
jgi:hypothetical protein